MIVVWLNHEAVLHIVDDADTTGEPAESAKLTPLTVNNAPPLQGRFVGVNDETAGPSKLICPLQVPMTKPRVTTDEKGSALN